MGKSSVEKIIEWKIFLARSMVFKGGRNIVGTGQSTVIGTETGRGKSGDESVGIERVGRIVGTRGPGGTVVGARGLVGMFVGTEIGAVVGARGLVGTLFVGTEIGAGESSSVSVKITISGRRKSEGVGCLAEQRNRASAVPAVVGDSR